MKLWRIALLGSFSITPSLKALPITITPCALCFPAGDVATLSVVSGTTTQGQSVRSNVSNSTVPISDAFGGSSPDGKANAFSSYAREFDTGFHFSEQASTEFGGSAEAVVDPFITDYLYVEGAKFGDTLSVDGNFEFLGTFQGTVIGGRESGDSFLPYLFLQNQGLSFPTQIGGNCGNYGYRNFAGGVNGHCSSTSSLDPRFPILQLQYFILSSTAGINGGGATIFANDTAYISNIQVLDASGVPDSGVRVYSASGVNYNAPRADTEAPAPVPELPSVALLSPGALVGLVLARTRP